eukprot:81585_1
MSTTNLLKQQLILSTVHHHDESMKRLETKYTDFISKVLDQKNSIVIKMKQEFNQRMTYIRTLDASQVLQEIHADHFKTRHDFNLNIPSFPELPMLEAAPVPAPRSHSHAAMTTFEACSGTESDTSCSILSEMPALNDEDTTTTITCTPPPRPPPPPPKPRSNGIQSLKDGLSDVFTEFKEEYIQITQNQTDKYQSLEQTRQQLQNDLEHTIHQTNKYKRDNIGTESFLRFLRERKSDLLQRKEEVEQQMKSLEKESLDKESSLECIDGLSRLFGCVIPEQMESGLGLPKAIKKEENHEDDDVVSHAEQMDKKMEASQDKYMLNMKHNSAQNELRGFMELILISYTKRVPFICFNGVSLDAFGFSLINLFILYQFIEIQPDDLKRRRNETYDVRITFKYHSGLMLKGFLLSEFKEKDDCVLSEKMVARKVNAYKDSRTYHPDDVFYGITFSLQNKSVLMLTNMAKGADGAITAMRNLCGFFVVNRGIVCGNDYQQKRVRHTSQRIGRPRNIRRIQRNKIYSRKRRSKQRRSEAVCRVRDRGRWRNRNNDNESSRDDRYYGYQKRVRSRSRSRSRTRNQYQDLDRAREDHPLEI